MAPASTYLLPRFDKSYNTIETRNWLICPMLRWLDRRWTPRVDDRGRRLIGKAIASGLNLYYRALQRGEPTGWESVSQVALDTMRTEWGEGDGEYTLEGATVVASKALRLAIQTDLVRGGQIVAVEQDIGGLRPDLIVRWPGAGGLAIIDHKWSAKLEAEWASKRLAGQETDIQLWMYGVRARTMFGEPVKFAGFHHITLLPRARTWCEPIILDETRLDLFARDLEHAHFAMSMEDSVTDSEDGAHVLGRWTACLSRDENYGRCRMYDACHTYHRDPIKMQSTYAPRLLPDYNP